MNSCTRLCVVILLIYCITAIVESAPQLRVHLDKKHNFKQHCAALCERAGGHGEFVAKESLCKCSTKKPQDIQARSAKKNTGTISMPLEFVRAKTLNKRQVQPDQGSNGEEQTKPVDPTSLVAENVVETSAERGKGQSDENSPTSRTWVDPETVKMQESKYLEMNVNNSTGTPEAKIEPMSVKCKQNATAQHAEKTRRRLDCTEINHPKSKDYQEYLKVTSSSKVPKPTEATTPDRIVGVAPVEMRNRKDDDGKVIYYPNTRGDRPKQVTSSSNITKPAAAENSEEIATATAEAATTIRSMERIAGLESLKMRNGGDNKDKVIHHPNTKKHDDRKIIKVTSSSKKEKPQPAEASGIETTTAEVEIATAEAATTIRSMERIAGSESLKMRNKRDDKDKVIHHPNTKMHEDRDIVKVTSSSKKKKPQPAEAGGIEITTAEAETVTVEVATTIRSMERVAGLESINMRNGVEDGIVGVAPVKDDGKVIYYPNTRGDRPKAVASSSKITKPAAEGNSEEITTAKVETATAEVATTNRSMERVAGLESLKMRNKRDGKDTVIHHPNTKKHEDRKILKVTSSSKKEEPQPGEASGTETTTAEVDLTTEVVTTATPAAKRQARSADSNQQEPITGQRAPGHRRTRPLHQRRQGIHQLTPHLPHHHAPHFPQHNPHFPQHTPHLPHLSQPGHIPHHPHLPQGHHSFPHLRSARPTHPIVASIRERIANLRSQREKSTSGPITGATRRTTESRFGKKTDTGNMNAQLREREKKRQIAKTQSGGAPRMDDVNNHGAAASTISAQNSNSRAGTQQNYQIITQPPNLVS